MNKENIAGQIQSSVVMRGLITFVLLVAVACVEETTHNGTIPEVPVGRTTSEAIQRGVMLSACPSMAMLLMSALVTYVRYRLTSDKLDCKPY
jgi:hypothetical protein